jgi:hypothetical protein
LLTELEPPFDLVWILDSRHVPLLLRKVSSINPVKLICGVETHLSVFKLENLLIVTVSGRFKVLLRSSPSPSDVDLLLDAPVD